MAKLHEVDAWLAALLSQLEPTARKKMLREVARGARRAPHSAGKHHRAAFPRRTAWEPRRVTARSKKGRIRCSMFAKLKTAKYLKAQAGADTAEVAFMPGVQKLAIVHHYGLRDRVSRRGPMVKYAERSLMDVNGDVESTVREALLRWLAE